jgi:uncharacterized protein YfdQ (DUF2303 family)
MSPTPAQQPQMLVTGGPDRNEAEAIIDAARAGATPTRIKDGESGAEILVFPPDKEGMTPIVDVESELAAYRSAPAQAKGTVQVGTVDSLIHYATQHKTDGTDVWVHPTEGKVVAVINNHAPDPGWGDHRAVLNLVVTDEWKFWMRLNNNMVSQADFANHIEEGQREIVEPAAATMLEIAQTLHAQIGADFSSAIRLTDGNVQLKYVEETKATAGKAGDLKIPASFTIGVAPFQGENPFKVTARLRYRINGGHLQIGYILDRPQEVVKACLDAIADKLDDHFDHVYIGVPR